LYPCQDDPAERREFLSQVRTRLEELDKVLESSRRHRRSVLLKTDKRIDVWSEKLLKEKSIYHTMNLFNHDPGRKCLIAEGWCPKTSTGKIVDAMRRATESSGALVPSILSVVQHNDEPPTYFRLNRFTSAFQGIVDAYGIAHYREVNPAVFTLITFPFLFAVMFGDFGHGLIMTLFAGYLCWKEKSLEKVKLNEMIATCFNGRYLILLMGFFSMYTGLIYNECFSVALDLCGTNWHFNTPNILPNVTNAVNVAQPINPDRAYEFGVDPSWNGASNTLNYYNSLKMKLSIIFGVFHMCLGIFMSLLNAVHFGHTLDILFEFLPQIIFMLSLFGYMVFLIFYKWTVASWPMNPPFLLNVMIQMFLSPLNLKEENQVFPYQHPIQLVLLVLAIVAVPWMLFPKPLILRYTHKKNQQKRFLDLQDGENISEQHGESDFDFGEIFVKQSIHTIEFVLGAISNTASYLRLWALSLAHSELSVVFWDRVFIFLYHMGENKDGTSNMAIQWILVFFAWSAWAGATFAVLLLMESLSAFLHALRLHWVEFQNKFYHGDGTPFTPFSYDALRLAENVHDEPVS